MPYVWFWSFVFILFSNFFIRRFDVYILYSSSIFFDCFYVFVFHVVFSSSFSLHLLPFSFHILPISSSSYPHSQIFKFFYVRVFLPESVHFFSGVFVNIFKLILFFSLFQSHLVNFYSYFLRLLLLSPLPLYLLTHFFHRSQYFLLTASLIISKLLAFVYFFFVPFPFFYLFGSQSVSESVTLKKIKEKKNGFKKLPVVVNIFF